MAQTKAKKKTATKTTKKRTKKTADEKINAQNDEWVQAISQATNKPRPYSIRETYDLNDLIDHGSFGAGIVTQIIDEYKIEVLFQQGTKVLVHSR